MINRLKLLSGVLYILFKYALVYGLIAFSFILYEDFKNPKIVKEFTILIGLTFGALVVLSILEWVAAGKLIWSWIKNKGGEK